MIDGTGARLRSIILLREFGHIVSGLYIYRALVQRLRVGVQTGLRQAFAGEARSADIARMVGDGSGTGSDESEEEALLARIREVRAQHDALAAASPPVRSVLLRAACDPIVLRDVAVGLASGASASLAAATSDAARSLGIGLTLGDAVARACGWAEHLARRALSRGSDSRI